MKPSEKAQSDLRFILEYKSDAEQFFELLTRQPPFQEPHGVRVLREKIAKKAFEADKISMARLNTSAFPQILLNASQYNAGSFDVAIDYFNRLIGACDSEVERTLDEEHNPPPLYRRSGRIIARAYKAVFKTEKEQIAIRWILIVTLATGLFRLLGVDVVLMLKVLAIALLKKAGLL